MLRWEKTSRPFLRNVEFLWQEGHTMHETKEEAVAETLQMLDIYTELVEDHLAMPVIRGQKTESEKFAGAEATYTIEAMMHDGRALQSGTSHYFGTGFSKAFDITFTGRDNKDHFPHQTSWGVSTRLIGGIIMTHGDDNGLVLPPDIAPIQVAIIPIAQHKEGVLEKANALKEQLQEICRVKLDDSDNSPGWKFSEYEMKGVPLRLEIGPKDIEKGQCVLVRRDNREKIFVKLEDLASEIPKQLEALAKGLYQKALANRESKMFTAKNLEEMKDIFSAKTGFVKAMWCGDEACEEKIKQEAGLSSRCIPFEQEAIGETCACCGKKAKHLVYWGKAY